MFKINPQQVVRELVDFMRYSFERAGFTNAVIGVSGGVDSATSMALAVRALGSDVVFPLLLSYGNLNERGVLDAQTAFNRFKVPTQHTSIIDIKPLVDPLVALDPTMDHVRRGNIMARLRMTILFDQAKKRRALVVGTENKSEHLLGYFTRFGDEASDIEPLRNFYKTHVYQIAEYLGVQEDILLKKPTAGLWDGQTDEGEFGFTYKVADEILYYLFDQGKSIEEIVKLDFDRATIDKVKAQCDKNAFKHNLPIVVKRS